MAIPRRWGTLHILREHGAELLARVRIQRFTASGVEIESVEGEKRLVAANHVLLATGAAPDRRLAQALAPLGLDTHVVGDAEHVGYLEGAILSGARVGRAL